MVADDLGECHFGHARECRSASTGTPIPAPATPNLDLIAGYGTVFPVAHNTAPWCFPSLVSIVTGRYQRSFNGHRRPGSALGTIPSTLRSLDGAPFLPDDPYNAGNKIGGYCTFRGGKLSSGSVGEDGFDLIARTSERTLGRVSMRRRRARPAAALRERRREHLRAGRGPQDGRPLQVPRRLALPHPRERARPSSAPSRSSCSTRRAFRTSRCARRSPSATTSSARAQPIPWGGSSTSAASAAGRAARPA